MADNTAFFKAYAQDGAPGHCSLAQVFDPSGNSIATFDATSDPEISSAYADVLADTLNLHVIERMKDDVDLHTNGEQADAD